MFLVQREVFSENGDLLFAQRVGTEGEFDKRCQYKKKREKIRDSSLVKYMHGIEPGEGGKKEAEKVENIVKKVV